jgi:hypothetical protein
MAAATAADSGEGATEHRKGAIVLQRLEAPASRIDLVICLPI